MRFKWAFFTLLFLMASGAASSAPVERSAHFFPQKDLMRIGVFHYPKHWPLSQWERDFKAMARMGFEFTHFGEFAWSFLEPAEGTFEIEWLDKAIAPAAKEGLKVILYTPIPCPPAWMGEKYPEIYLVSPDGRRKSHGTRANASLSNPRCLEFVDRVVTELARGYGHDSRIMGWQIDNEPGAGPDHSPSARQAFHSWLKDRYGTVEALNETWGGSFWSFRYDRLDHWHAFGGGASFVSTYSFRHPRFGSELYHDGIVGTDGVSVSRGGQEFIQVMKGLRKLRGAWPIPPPPFPPTSPPAKLASCGAMT